MAEECNIQYGRSWFLWYVALAVSDFSRIGKQKIHEHFIRVCWNITTQGQSSLLKTLVEAVRNLSKIWMDICTSSRRLHTLHCFPRKRMLFDVGEVPYQAVWNLSQSACRWCMKQMHRTICTNFEGTSSLLVAPQWIKAYQFLRVERELKHGETKELFVVVPLLIDCSR